MKICAEKANKKLKKLESIPARRFNLVHPGALVINGSTNLTTTSYAIAYMGEVYAADGLEVHCTKPIPEEGIILGAAFPQTFIAPLADGTFEFASEKKLPSTDFSLCICAQLPASLIILIVDGPSEQFLAFSLKKTGSAIAFGKFLADLFAKNFKESQANNNPTSPEKVV